MEIPKAILLQTVKFKNKIQQLYVNIMSIEVITAEVLQQITFTGIIDIKIILFKLLPKGQCIQ